MSHLFVDSSVKPGIGVGVADVEGLAGFGDVAGDTGADGKSEWRIEILVKVVLDETFQDDGWHFRMLVRFKSSWVSVLKQSKHAYAR